MSVKYLTLEGFLWCYALEAKYGGW